MTDRDTLLRALAERPDDDTPRLAYADYLEENGDPLRAEFVRVQVQLARLPPGDPGNRPLVVRHLAFLKDHVPGWRAELPYLPGIEWGGFNRGLIEEVQARTEAAIVEHAAAIFAQPGIHVLRIGQLTDPWSLADLPELGRIRWLRLIGAVSDPDWLRVLLASPYLGKLTALELSGYEWRRGLGDAGAQAVADADLPSLATVWLDANIISDDGGRALAASPHLLRVRYLDLRQNAIGAPVRASLTKRFGPGVKF